MIRLRAMYPSKEDLKVAEEEAIGEEMEERRRNEPKYSRAEMAEKIVEMREREKIRQEKLSLLKLRTMEDYSKEFKRKPYVGR